MAGLYDARFMLKVKTADQWKRRHVKKRRESRELGVDVPELTIATPTLAMVEANRWILAARCECGSGVAVNPNWTEAYCMGDDCGRVYTNVVIPIHREAIEAELLKLKPALRWWYPGESANDVSKTSDEDMQRRYEAHHAKRQA